MRTFRKDIWKDGEYTYEAAYGFRPNIRAYIHDDCNRHDAMLVVPGGGYCMVVPHEGEVVAKRFYDKGMNVFVLTYTTDITFAIPLKLQPLKDISRAMRILRANADEYMINPDKIVICGFSAGGHVCGSLATHWQDIEDVGEYQGISNRPDGVILSYPVITTGEYTHIYSVWALIGQNAPKEEMDYFSLEKQVSDKTPPCFIWQTREDDLVPVENSYLFANALREAKVKHAHYVFPYGGHGMSIASADLAAGRYCSDYTFEQLSAAVSAVKAGKGIRVSEQRVEELKEQFADTPVVANEIGNATNPESWEAINDEEYEHPHKDVCMWPELAYEWIKSL